MLEFIKSVDLSVAEAVNGLSSSCGKVLTPILKIITLSGNSGLIFIVIAILMLFFKVTRKAGVTALIALAAGALFTNVILKNAIARPRPFWNESSEFYLFWKSAGSLSASGYSFPSGHTTAAAAFGFALFLLKNKKYSWAFLFIPVVMGFTRIYFGVHYFSDVLGAVLVGSVAATMAYFIVFLITKRKKSS